MRHKGLSLIEILVVIGIVAVLLGLTLPAIGLVRGAARQTESASNARQLTGLVKGRVELAGGRFPVVEPGVRYVQPFTKIRTRGPYWGIVNTWPLVLGSQAEDIGVADLMWSPGVRLDEAGRFDLVGASYVLTSTAAGDPRLWTGDAAPVEIEPLRRGARLDEVAFPASKALLWDRHLGWVRGDPSFDGPDRTERTPTTAFDGSVRSLSPASAREGALCHDPDQRLYVRERAALHNTPGRVLGVDW